MAYKLVQVGLQISIDAFFLDTRIPCRNCGIIIVNEINANAHLIIDIEHAFHSIILNKIRFLDARRNITLSEIPKHLRIKKMKNIN